MFQFPGCPPARLWIHLTVSRHCPGRVSPFGYPRIVTCLQFPVAFRSLPRPSSAVGALASTLCSYSLDFFVASSPETNYSLRYELSLIILCNWSSFDSSSSSLCSCQGAGPPACFRSPDPENDTGFLRFFERFDSFSSVSHGPRFAFALPCPPLAVFAAFFPMLSHRPTWFTRRRFLRLAP